MAVNHISPHANFRLAVSFLLLLITTGIGLRAAELAEKTLEFPPGSFTDNSLFRVGDCHGKVLVLCFYDPTVMEGWGDPQIVRWLLSEFREQPVKFAAVVPGQTIEQVRSAPGDMPEIPAFADTLCVMEHRAGGPRSTSGQWRYTIVGADGKTLGKLGEDLDHAFSDIEHAIAGAHWSYKSQSMPRKLGPAVDLLESRHFGEAVKLLRPLVSDRDAGTLRAARELLERLRNEANGWRARAQGLERDDPIAAYDEYSHVAEVCGDQEAGRSALREIHRLKDMPIVRRELSARVEYRRLDSISTAAGDARERVIKLCRQIALTYSNIPTAAEAAALADEVESISPAPRAARSVPAYMIRIDNLFGAHGFSLLYRLTPDEIVVGSISDWAGVGPKEQDRAPLTAVQRNSIEQFLRQFPLEQLQDRYVDPNVNDGFQCTFDVRLAGRPRRVILVANRRQRELSQLCDEINHLLPDKLRIDMPR